MPTNNFPNIGYNTIGFDRNYFQRISVSWTAFGANSVSGQQPDMIIALTNTTQGVIIINEDATNVIEISFNGNTVHERLDPTIVKGICYDNRTISTIWFRLASGSAGPAEVSVRAWVE